MGQTASYYSKEHRSTDPLLSSWDIPGLVTYIKEQNVHSVLVLIGAGASVGAGIPDFRGPNGLYSNVQKYTSALSSPEKLFDLETFKQDPSIFYSVARALDFWPGDIYPTAVHDFVALLEKHNMLLRCYTQNIDTLERRAGISESKIVEAHGSFATAKCIECYEPYSIEKVHQAVEKGSVPKCEHCKDGGLIKPDVVFFGESLPMSFFHQLQEDVPKADLCLIIGTSLMVIPFSLVPRALPPNVPRVLINLNRAGGADFVYQTDVQNAEIVDGVETPIAALEGIVISEKESQKSANAGGRIRPKFHDDDSSDDEINYTGGRCLRDLFLQGDAQTIIVDLARELGWELELKECTSKHEELRRVANERKELAQKQKINKWN